MRAIKEARKLIEKSPNSQAARIFSRLVLALESEGECQISDIYLLDYDHFNLALEILKEWRLDRHYAGKSRLFDVSRQLADMNEPKNKKAIPVGKDGSTSSSTGR